MKKGRGNGDEKKWKEKGKERKGKKRQREERKREKKRRDMTSLTRTRGCSVNKNT